MTKYTAGPWKAQPLAHGAYGIWDDLGRLVAETRNTEDTYDRRPGSPSTPEAGPANARLIAQAPAMLETLRNAFASWFRDPLNFNKTEPEWVTNARSAITAAEGRD